MFSRFLLLGLVASATAQLAGNVQAEAHPKLSWKRCEKSGSCQKVNGEVVIDSNWRWMHVNDGFQSCMLDAEWNEEACDSVDSCTEKCAVDGADYRSTFGVTTKSDSIQLRYKTPSQFGNNVNSRLFLMENENKYQTFTLLNNEVAVDVDLSSVECGINAALYFVAMDPDGGKAKYPTNKAGAKYGTGYCDASCPRSNRFNGGKANYDYWSPSPTDKLNGMGYRGACCAEFDVLNSNAHSFSMASKPCIDVEYEVCEAQDCDDSSRFPRCDRSGCEYQPYRLDNKGFYGRGKTVDTKKNFTVVTRFEERKVYQFFVQDGKRIESPSPAVPGFPADNGLTSDYCDAKSEVFNEFDAFNVVGGFHQHVEALRHPMVLTMALTDDHWAHNLWLDSIWPLDAGPQPGVERGPCLPEYNDPIFTEANWAKATVVWSNIRFGPIGSTVVV